MVLLSEIREDLQVGLDILYDYCHRWKLTINTEKTSIIIFRKGGTVTQHDHLFFDDRRLNLLDKISYLGLKPCYRYYFLKFVTKNHNLPVVRGKWFQPKPYNERLCSTCEVLGDEYHFLFQCTKHQDLRSKFFARYYWERPSMYKFVELMSSQRKVA